jgi:hypothetical protein
MIRSFARKGNPGCLRASFDIFNSGTSFSFDVMHQQGVRIFDRVRHVLRQLNQNEECIKPGSTSISLLRFFSIPVRLEHHIDP